MTDFVPLLIRPYWRCYYSNTDAIIYVVDSADRDRMGISKQELVSMLEEEELKGAVLVVLANKQDIEGAMSVTEVMGQFFKISTPYVHSIFPKKIFYIYKNLLVNEINAVVNCYIFAGSPSFGLGSPEKPYLPNLQGLCNQGRGAGRVNGVAVQRVAKQKIVQNLFCIKDSELDFLMICFVIA